MDLSILDTKETGGRINQEKLLEFPISQEFLKKKMKGKRADQKERLRHSAWQKCASEGPLGHVSEKDKK